MPFHYSQTNLNFIISNDITPTQATQCMRLTVIEKNSFSQAFYNSDEKIVYFKIWGEADIYQTKLVLQSQIDFASAHKILGICTDLSELTGTIAPMSGYIASEYFPALIANGLVCNAIIVSRDIFSQIAAKDLIKRMGNYGIKLFFEDLEAEQWVRTTVLQNS